MDDGRCRTRDVVTYAYSLPPRLMQQSTLPPVALHYNVFIVQHTVEHRRLVVSVMHLRLDLIIVYTVYLETSLFCSFYMELFNAYKK